jgi:CRISPR-associated endonuclease/helicase Cas3
MTDCTSPAQPAPARPGPLKPQGIHFWAKTTPAGAPGVSVYEHMLNVGRVAQCLAQTAPELLGRFHILDSQVGALAALHDLGKISPGFQRKCAAWLLANGLVEIDRNNCWDTGTEPNHAKVTHAAVQRFLAAKEMPSKSAACIAALLGAHHGRIQQAPNSRPSAASGISEDRSGIDWEKERDQAAESILSVLAPDLPGVRMTDTDPALWWLAGLTTVSDWIGSDERHFPAEGGMDDVRRMAQALATINDIGFGTPRIVPGLGFAELFGFSQPNDMQVRARELIQGPGVYVIEAPMGMGKTEAALWAAYELLTAGKARGIYFALPTQATSNRIHLRMNEFVNRVSPEVGASRLIHGNSWLMQKVPSLLPAKSEESQDGDARLGADWFASTKRSLLAPFGVGTVDQALLGVVAAKHFFVRRFALAGKVVILDEIHSYDLYTGTLIDQLVGVLKGLGCTVIVLSATLTAKRRQQLVPLESDAAMDPVIKKRPLISGDPEGARPVMASALPPAAKTVKTTFLTTESALGRATDFAARGGVVLWICNTVGSAQSQYQQIAHVADSRFKVGLLHSRFPFWRREELENEWMNRLGKSGETRCGCILVSTQIVEQSVDLDADLLVTELAPTDMLLQRMGRLWRHERPGRQGTPEAIILEETEGLEKFRQLGPEAVKKALGTKAFVYSPYVLMRSLEVWKSATELTIPDQIRERIEATYEERIEGEEPKAWQKLFNEMDGKRIAHRQMALQSSNVWTILLKDEEGVQTRLDDQPAISIVLCRSVDASHVIFLDGSTETVAKEGFQLPLAQKIHKNVVRVPLHLFDTVKPVPAFDRYLHGTQTLGLVEEQAIQVEGLKDGIRLRWSTEVGVSIEKDSSRSQE